MAANPNMAPPPVKLVVEKITLQVCEPKSVGPKQRFRDLLVKIFQGHGEFLGWTPD